MPELVLEAFESSVTMATSGTLATQAVPTLDVSAAAVFMVDVANMQSVFLTGTHADMATDGNGDKYMTNSTTTNANLGKILFEQLTSTVPARFASLSDSNAKQAMPLQADDVLSFKITINPATNQENLTSVSTIPPRTYKIKLLMKATADIANTTVDANE